MFFCVMCYYEGFTRFLWELRGGVVWFVGDFGKAFRERLFSGFEGRVGFIRRRSRDGYFGRIVN